MKKPKYNIGDYITDKYSKPPEGGLIVLIVEDASGDGIVYAIKIDEDKEYGMDYEEYLSDCPSDNIIESICGPGDRIYWIYEDHVKIAKGKPTSLYQQEKQIRKEIGL